MRFKNSYKTFNTSDKPQNNLKIVDNDNNNRLNIRS